MAGLVGSVMVVTVPVAAMVPLLVVLAEYDVVWPTTAVAGPLMVVARSAVGVTVTVLVAELAPVSGPWVVLVPTVVLAVMLAKPAGAFRMFTVRFWLAPLASVVGEPVKVTAPVPSL